MHLYFNFPFVEMVVVVF